MHTGVTCSNFLSNNPSDELTDATYGVKSGKVNNVAPGVMFHYISITAPSTSFTVNVTQSNDAGWKPIPAAGSNQVILYSAPSCTKLKTGSYNATTGTSSILVTGATGATYVVGVKYSLSDLAGQSVSAPYPVVTYSFATHSMRARISRAVRTPSRCLRSPRGTRRSSIYTMGGSATGLHPSRRGSGAGAHWKLSVEGDLPEARSSEARDRRHPLRQARQVRAGDRPPVRAVQVRTAAGSRKSGPHGYARSRTATRSYAHHGQEPERRDPRPDQGPLGVSPRESKRRGQSWPSCQGCLQQAPSEGRSWA